MKRSTKVALGAAGLLTAAWGVERAMQPRLPPCPIGPDGKPIVTAQCRTSSGSSSSSGSRSYYGWGGSSSSGSSAATTAGRASTSATSSGGWGAIGRAFSGGSRGG